ncbi:MAG: hypothetical protein Q8P76_04105 [bacterium]|nr:hypothetical protein [bacterium]
MKTTALALILLAGSAGATIGTNSGLTALYISGSEIYVTSASTNTVKIFRFSPPSTLAQVGIPASTDQEPVFISVPNPYAYVLNRGAKTLQTFIADDNFLLPLGSVPVGFNPTSAVVRIPHILITNSGSNSLQALDVSCNSRPVTIGRISTGSVPTSLYAEGKYAFVTCSGEDLYQIFNIGKLRWGISLTGSIKTDEGPVASYVAGPNAFVINTIANTLQAFNVSDPVKPAELGWVRTSVGPIAITGSGNLLFVACRFSNTLEIFDASNPAKMVLLHGIGVDYGPTAVAVNGPYAFVASHKMLQVFDVSDPLRKPPVLVASITVN